MRSSRFALGVLTVSATLGLMVFGCGGIDEPDLFAPAGSTTGDGGKGDGKADARSDAAAKDGATLDSGPPGNGTIFCSSGDCSIADNQVCCYSGDQTGTCAAPNGCSGGSFAIPCDDSQDCTNLGHPGDVCCAQADQSGNVTGVECVSPSNCSASNGQTNLCDPTASDPCPNGGTCSPSTVSIPGYDICIM